MTITYPVKIQILPVAQKGGKRKEKRKRKKHLQTEKIYLACFQC